MTKYLPADGDSGHESVTGPMLARGKGVNERVDTDPRLEINTARFPTWFGATLWWIHGYMRALGSSLSLSSEIHLRVFPWNIRQDVRNVRKNIVKVGKYLPTEP